MSGLDTSQAITDEVSLHAAEHHAHSLPHDDEDASEGQRPAAAENPDADAPQDQA
jgi:hypothetical protein